MSPADLRAKLKRQDELGALWVRVADEGYLVRQHPDRRDILVTHEEGRPLSPAAAELLRCGPEVFDVIEGAGRLYQALMGEEPGRCP